jgi:antitoxin (DNA-binding transcriptional repressor) of toxin-antitoxin stability system
MKSIPISEFKSRCIALLKEAQRSGKGLIVTWRGHPLARIEPIGKNPAKRQLGIFRGRMKIKGDVVRTDSSKDWEMLR